MKTLLALTTLLVFSLLAGACQEEPPVGPTDTSHTADSLRRADSLHRIDSLRRADSIQRTESDLRIDGFSPEAGEAGTEVTITGNGFGYNAAEVRVLFGDSVARIIRMSAKWILAVVPDNAVSGPISVMVGGVRVRSRQSFTILHPFGRFSEVHISLGNIAWIDQAASQPTDVPINRRQFWKVAACSGNSCSSDSAGWHLLVDHSHDIGSSTNEKYSVLIDTARREIAEIVYSLGSYYLTGTLTSDRGWTQYTMRCVLKHLPYTVLADGSLVCDISGSTVQDRLIELKEQSYGMRKDRDGSGRITTVNFDDGWRKSDLQPDEATIHILLKQE